MAERLPFDPSRIRPPARSAGRGARSGEGLTLISPREVNELLRGAINAHIPSTLHVLGEVGELSRAGSGHLYFSLKDASSEIRCVMWRSAATKLGFQLETGLEIIATGGLEVYSPRGTVQLMVRKLEPRGVGALEIAFRQLKARLEREGLFDPARKRPLPRVPRRVALVTSPSGAAIRDILKTLERRFAALEIFVFPTRVQGEGAAVEIAAAIELLNEVSSRLGGIDVAIVGRGGGSLEDLWAFNEEIVARAIVASRVPIVSAVGHEVDVSISDLVADVRAATPTAAAELITPRLDDLLEALALLELRATRAARSGCDAARARLHRCLASERLAQPRLVLRERSQRLDELEHRLRQGLMEQAREARQRLSRADTRMAGFGSGAWVARVAGALARNGFRLRTAIDRLLHGRQRRIDALRMRLRSALPERTLGAYGQWLRQTVAGLSRRVTQMLGHRRALLAARLEAVHACDPRGVLRRGYSITRDARTRRVLRSLADVRDGQRLTTELADGEFRSTADDPRQPRLFE